MKIYVLLIFFSSFQKFKITSPLNKNGICGIRNRTRAPKLEVEIATEKEKKIANIKEKSTMGLENKFLRLEIGFLKNT